MIWSQTGYAQVRPSGTNDNSEFWSKQLQKPKDLGPDGSALLDALAGNEDYTLRPDEYRVLAAACRQADVVAALEAAFADDPRYLVRGSNGNMVVNGLITEARLGRAELARLLKALGVPDDEERANQRAQDMAKRMSELGKLSWKKRSGG